MRIVMRNIVLHAKMSSRQPALNQGKAGRMAKKQSVKALNRKSSMMVERKMGWLASSRYEGGDASQEHSHEYCACIHFRLLYKVHADIKMLGTCHGSREFVD